MTKKERDRRIEELERKADKLGCCIIPAVPVPPASSDAARTSA